MYCLSHCTNRASPFVLQDLKDTPPGMTVKFQILMYYTLTIITDHLINKQLLKYQKNPNFFLVPLGLQKWFEDKGINNVIEMDWWGQNCQEY